MTPTVASFMQLLGKPFPAAPLDVRVLSEEECGSHTRQLVEYGTVNDERVQAYLLVPQPPQGKMPGVLAIHQDGGSRPYQFGKSEPAGVAGDPELAYGMECCERGYVVVCPDRLPFESRSLANSSFKETFGAFRITVLLNGNIEVNITEDLYQGCVNNRTLFDGWTPMGKTLFELQRAVDVLCDRPEVDSDQVGVVGHSGGGFFSVLVMYVDQRIKAGVSSTGPFLIRRFAYASDYLRPNNGFGSELAVPGMGQWGDVDDVLAGLAPRPFLDTWGDQGIPDSQFEELVVKARLAYERLGVPERFEQIIYPGGHIFRKDIRERAYSWFDRWLKQA